MPARGETRDRILRTAAELFRRKGYGSVGLAQVVSASGAPKGVMYFHFPEGKAQLAAESVALSGGELGARMGAVIQQADDIPAAIAGLGRLFAADLEASGFQDGCPVATVALDAADQSDQIRSACESVYALWLEGLAGYLRANGIGAARAPELAALIFTSLQGALLLARVQRDTSVIHLVTGQLGTAAEQAARAT
jgi:AcrR family transcriptional regulator